MKEVKILTMDNRGRILLPQSLRKILGISPESKLIATADSELKEMKISPIALGEAQRLLKLKITMEDVPGALGKIAATLGDLGISIIYSEGAVLEKAKTATYTAIVQNIDFSFDELKNALITKGSAIDVKLLPLE
jgi:bifunctional DNA-binding transcriptional regulator/antitoxin component of YhaV-PrlF toxin-antitoxin module